MANQMKGAERRQEAALAQRDFGYNEHIPFMPNTYAGPDPSSAFSTALASGLMGAAANTMGFAGEIHGTMGAEGIPTAKQYWGGLFGGNK